MDTHFYLVFSKPVSGQEEAYHEWYDRHVADLVRVPGFRSAQRCVAARGAGLPERYTHEYAVVYEVEGDPAQAINALRAAVAAGEAERPDPACVQGDILSLIYTPIRQRVTHEKG